MSIQPHTPRTSKEIVADNLRAELARKRMSGRTAAVALGVNHVWVARRVNAEVEMNVSDIVAFSNLLDINPEVLFADTKNAPTPKGGGKQLPELDSNQQPAGNKPNNIIEVDFTSYHSTELDTIATVTPLFA